MYISLSKPLIKKFNAFTLLLYFIFPTIGLSGTFDYFLDVSARTYTLGALISYEMGFNQYLWGQKEPGSIMYGYIRPAVRVSTVAIVQNGDIFLDIFPISFLHIRAGHTESYRHIPSLILDCSNYECTGRMNSNFVQSDLTFGFKDFFGYIWGEFRRFNPNQGALPFYDQNTVLIGQAGGDSMTKFSVALGMKLGRDFMALASYDQYNMLSTGQSANQQIASVGKNFSPTLFSALGLVSYQADLVRRGYGVVAYFKWTGKKSLALD